MDFKFPIWISGSTAYDSRLVAFSTAARAYAYLSASVIGEVQIELVAEVRFRSILSRFGAQGGVEILFDPEQDDSATMEICSLGNE